MAGRRDRLLRPGRVGHARALAGPGSASSSRRESPLVPPTPAPVLARASPPRVARTRAICRCRGSPRRVGNNGSMIAKNGAPRDERRGQAAEGRAAEPPAAELPAVQRAAVQQPAAEQPAQGRDRGQAGPPRTGPPGSGQPRSRRRRAQRARGASSAPRCRPPGGAGRGGRGTRREDDEPAAHQRDREGADEAAGTRQGDGHRRLLREGDVLTPLRTPTPLPRLPPARARPAGRARADRPVQRTRVVALPRRLVADALLLLHDLRSRTWCGAGSRRTLTPGVRRVGGQTGGRVIDSTSSASSSCCSVRSPRST